MSSANQTQLIMDYRLPLGQEHVTPKELGYAAGFSARHVIDSFDEGKIFGFSSNGRGKKGQEVRSTIRIPREHAVAWLCARANYDADMLLDNLIDCAAKLPRELRRELIHQLSKRL